MSDVPTRPQEASPDLASALGLGHFYGSGDTRAQILTDIDITIPPGQLIIMTGPSGSGKTTLLTLLGALRSSQSGAVQILGRDVSGLGETGLIELRRNIGFIFQLHNLLESLSAVDNVVMAAQLFKRSPGEARQRAVHLLERVGLGHRLDNKPSALSGGQRQRVAVARALVNAPRLILADEPTAALDIKSSVEIVTLLQEHITNNGSSCLMVTHDNRILDRADRIVSLVDGRIVSDVMIKEQIVLCEMLSKVEFFRGLGTAELGQVAATMERRPFTTGDILIRQGDVGEHFFLLRSGELDVHVAGTDGAVNTLVAGRYFGERALISGEVRNATIVARTPGVAYALDKARFTAAIDATPTLQEQIRKSYFNK